MYDVTTYRGDKAEKGLPGYLALGPSVLQTTGSRCCCFKINGWWVLACVVSVVCEREAAQLLWDTFEEFK